MSKPVIEVENLSKLYAFGPRRPSTLREAMGNWWYKIRGRNIPSNVQSHVEKFAAHQAGPVPGTFWALKDVSFSVHEGEALGIIGNNGAGKSTLLRILAKITEPTSGQARIRGRVSSLLEVGTGFHPELTGRENIYLNGAILGMRKREINAKFDEILAFSEIEKFIDTPVKYYSSGMYVRLAFSVAAHLEPEILLVDEVLAVGDSNFQKKCLEKMDGVARGGKTVIFVSHNPHAVLTLSHNALVFDLGRLCFNGNVAEAMLYYREKNVSISETLKPVFFAPDKKAGLLRAEIKTSYPNGFHQFGKPLLFEFEAVFPQKPKAGSFSFQISDSQARPVAHLWIENIESGWIDQGRVRLRCVLPHPRLYMGRYTVTTHLSDRASLEHHETLNGICSFSVVMDGMKREHEWRPGACAYLEDGQWQKF